MFASYLFDDTRSAYDYYKNHINQPSSENKDACDVIKKNSDKEHELGSGSYGRVVAYKGCNDFVVKFADGDINIKNVSNDTDVIIDDDLAVEFVFTNTVSRFYINKESAMFYSIPIVMECDDMKQSRITIAPKFAGDMSILFKLPGSVSSYNVDFCTLCVFHSIMMFQRKFGIVHRDLKPLNVLLENINTAMWYDEKGEYSLIKKSKNVVLDFGDGIKFSFETSKLRYIPKIGDWGFACSFKDHVYSNQFSHVHCAGGARFGIPNTYNEWYDSYFFTAHACIYNNIKFKTTPFLLYAFCNLFNKMSHYSSLAKSGSKKFVVDSIAECINITDGVNAYRLNFDKRLVQHTTKDIIKSFYESPYNIYKFQNGLVIAKMCNYEHTLKDQTFGDNISQSDIEHRKNLYYLYGTRSSDSLVEDAKASILTRVDYGMWYDMDIAYLNKILCMFKTREGYIITAYGKKRTGWIPIGLINNNRIPWGVQKDGKLYILMDRVIKDFIGDIFKTSERAEKYISKFRGDRYYIVESAISI
jgi:hypothetical protein